MDNRHGLITDLSVMTPSMGITETKAALDLLARQRTKHLRPKSVGGDKNYHNQEFVSALRQRGIKPHVARKAGQVTPGLDNRTSQSRSYQISQVVRKRIEQIFGWGKTIGGLRKTRFKGVARTQHLAQLTGATYNLLRISRLCPTTG